MGNKGAKGAWQAWLNRASESVPHFVLPKRTVKQSLWRTLKRGSKCRKKKDKKEGKIERQGEAKKKKERKEKNV